MPSIELEETDWTKAKKIWAHYRRHHDLSDRVGQAVGIDPRSGGIWFGASIADIVAQRSKQGLDSPLLFERFGAPSYLRKGRH